ncbi:MAG: cytochrome c1 [Bosea sp. (in: a-proteobacteria)]|jgi:ubiquinol-cytochrome c reductase cytochrome c1 subunit|uniref:cytochrome c1 n=1 Tax=Bosea sp. (in: a-proteobacteria) TaxID=1871050 RepID=UPI000B2BDC8A|nr:cytochrome c1 [Bosea sp. (in: a-proteobacteria)]MBA4270172.1 cytochrome c1 [Methylobacterium sp.]MCZ8043381.1 cytochrome c1 [Beijerinckiaceae bacterium]MDP3602956.1 cytochrome c1 [Bosea sp. (in: a-proteobacteria)]WRH60280.1 MAG: cytochrome c1 [Bosea sp. (in: a-proteobacteria)]
MITLSVRSAALGLLLAALPLTAQAAGARVEPPALSWSFSGPFGTFDRAQLQRGYKVYKEVCANCHSASLLKFRNLSQPGGPEFTPGQVTALAATYQIKDGPNEAGEMFERPGRAADAFPSPFPNEQAARSANGGAYPPDLSVIAKARTYERGFPRFVFDIFTQYQEQGPDYLAALLTGYKDPPPEGVTLLPGQYYNTYMPGHLIAMPNVLNDGQVEFPKGPDGQPQVPETAKQYAKDVTAFLMWAAEPHLEARKRIGLQVMLFLLMFGTLLYYTKKKVWSRMPDGTAAH